MVREINKTEFNELLNQIGTEKPDTRPKPKVTKKPRTKKVVKQNED